MPARPHAPLALAVLLLAGCNAPTTATQKAPAPAAPPAPVKTEAPAGVYALDPAHADLSFKVNHIGFSNYTARFTRFDAKLVLDPADPTRTTVEATVDPRSLALPSPPAGFTQALLGPDWLDAGKYPQITFRSTSVELTGADTARIHGDLTLHGQTKPIVLEAKFNGGYAGNSFDPHARIGFSAHGAFKRSDFGVSYGLPPPNSTMGVGDEVTVALEAEFTGPAWTPPPKP